MNIGTRFAHLNLDLNWPGFMLKNLEKDADGKLTLARVPLVVEDVGAGENSASVPTPTTPSGIATTGDCACDVYMSDPTNHRIWRFDSCEGEAKARPYLGGQGSLPGELNMPRGLVIVNRVLYVADSGNHRIQVIALDTQQPLTVWGQPDPYVTPTPSSDPGRLNEPWTMAADGEGNIYAVDHGNARVQKFTPRGQVIETFWQTMSAQSNKPLEPINIAMADERMYVLDRGAQPRVLVFDANGVAHTPEAWTVGDVPNPIALATTSDAIYVGGVDGTIVKYSVTGTYMSTLVSAGHPLAALAVGCADELLATPGGLPFWRLRFDMGYMPAGYFRVGPFQTTAHALAWHRWRVLADALDKNAHVQLYTYSSTTLAPPPDAGGDNPFATSWFAQPRDELDVLVLSQPVRDALSAGPPTDPTQDQDEGTLQTTNFWLGGLLRGDGKVSPVLRQMRIDYTPTTYIRYLPAIYREGVRRRLFLELALAALDSELGRAEEIMAGLPALFDPAVAPPEWLPWLATWLDFDLIEEWPTDATRRNIVDAVELYAQRGTAEGLRRYLKLYAGVEARIEEPSASVALFTFDEKVALGFNTVLAPAHEQGAVFASTATLGQSHLLTPEEIGAPLFQDIVHRFCVQVYASQLTNPRVRDVLMMALEREKPAHIDYHLCVIDARMRVGFQSRVGIDSIVAGPAPDLRLGETTALGTDTVLANQPPRSRRIGQGVHVDVTI